MEHVKLRLICILCAAMLLSACGETQSAADGPIPPSDEGSVTASPAAGKAGARPTPAASGSYPARYRGVHLPPPDPIKAPMGFQVRLPGAWVVADGEAVSGTQAGYTYVGGEESIHVDAASPGMIPTVVSIAVPDREAPIIVVGSAAVEEFEATLQGWGGSPKLPFGPSAVRLRPEVKREDSVTAYTLKPLRDRTEKLLAVSVKFQGGNESLYYWRLRPSE